VAPVGEAGAPPFSQLHANLKPETQNSFWAFDSADEQRIADETLARWYAQHDRAYEAELRDHFLPAGPAGRAPEAAVPCGYEAWTAFLRSARGAVAIRAAWERKASAWRRRLSQPDDETKP